uniref:hypothetical protein n=1 Tax=Algoriphagus sp. TaxID=1872435 RepID=UPI002583A91B|nr:hypothetical protein [Algoriphagus sp.]
MFDIIINIIWILVVLSLFFYVKSASKKKEAEIRLLIQKEIESNDRVTAALDRNTAAIRESDLEYEYGASKNELINKLKDAWIADQAKETFTTPFIEWLMREVNGV